jgi:PBP1b-binding outer membrane lipoprotein LpoB
MNRLLRALAIALLLTGCHGHDKATADNTPSESEVQAGTTKDSADPRLNALQRTKRTMNKIETEHKNAVDGADGTDPQAP